MTGQNPDTENAIREWLADSAPHAAPASLRRTLEEVTSGPEGHARRRFARRPSLLLAGRMAAAVAILAIAASTLYLYGQGRPAATGPSSSSSSGSTTSPSVSASASMPPSPTPADTVTPTATETPSPTSPSRSATVTQLPASSWSLVAGALPQTEQTVTGSYHQPVFALPSGGFIAFVPAASGETRAFVSTDGLQWRELAALLTVGVVVSDVTEAGGTIVAAGRVEGGDPAHTSAIAWTLDGSTWQSFAPSPEDGSSFDHVAAGPAGFLISGLGPTGFRLWSSRDGATWSPVAETGIPSDVYQSELLGNARGYVAAQVFAPRVWQSTDGIHWTETYRAPALSGLSNYYMGSIVRAPDGSYRSFGGIYTGTGIASPVLGDTWIWTSPDMTHWTISGSIKSPGWIHAVVSTAGGFVAAGTQPASASGWGASLFGPLAAWTSGEGRSWQRIAGLSSLPNSQVLAVVSDGTHAVIVFVDAQNNLELLVGAGLK